MAIESFYARTHRALGPGQGRNRLNDRKRAGLRSLTERGRRRHGMGGAGPLLHSVRPIRLARPARPQGLALDL